MVTVTALEGRRLQLTEQLRLVGPALQVARREQAEALALRDRLVAEAQGAQRQRRLAAASLAEAQTAVKAAEAARAGTEGDCRGLRRTLQRLLQLLNTVATEEEANSEPPVREEMKQANPPFMLNLEVAADPHAMESEVATVTSSIDQVELECRTMEAERMPTAEVTEVELECRKMEAERMPAAEVAEVMERSLEENIASLREVGETLRRRLALERDKQLRLETAARSKFKRAEEKQAQLKRELEERQADEQVWRGRVDSQDSLTQAAFGEAAQRRKALAAVEARAKRQYDEKRALQLELVELKQEQGRMRQDLASVLEALRDHAQRKEAARRDFCLRHLAKVDHRLDRRRVLDQDFLVTEVLSL